MRERERERERERIIFESCWRPNNHRRSTCLIRLPGSRFDGMIPGSVVAVAINRVMLRRKKKSAIKVV